MTTTSAKPPSGDFIAMPCLGVFAIAVTEWAERR